MNWVWSALISVWAMTRVIWVCVRWVGYDEGNWDTLARQGKTDKRWEETKEEEVENEDDVRWVGYDEGYWDTLAWQDKTSDSKARE